MRARAFPCGAEIAQEERKSRRKILTRWMERRGVVLNYKNDNKTMRRAGGGGGGPLIRHGEPRPPSLNLCLEALSATRAPAANSHHEGQ